MNNEIVRIENKDLGEQCFFARHKSGLPIYVFPKKLSTYYAIFATRYGANDSCFAVRDGEPLTEVPDGIAHFLEHKMFESPDGEDAFFKFGKTGAYANAFTSSTMTAYLFSCTESFRESLEILLDFVQTPHFTKENVEKEMGIIAQEIRMYEDNPSSAMYRGLMQAMYREHPIRRSVAGTVESISEITPDLLYTCYRTFYHPENMALIVCGDVTAEEVLEIADTALPEKMEPFAVRRATYDEPPSVSEAKVSVQMEVARPLFEIGVKDVNISPDPAERMKKSAAMEILNEILFSKTSPFYTELYEEGLISESLGYTFKHCTAYSFELLAGESLDPDRVFDKFKSYIAKMQETGVDAESFRLCRRSVYASFIKGFDSTENIAQELLDMTFDDCNMLEYPTILANTEIDDVNALLRDFFREDAFAVSTVLPMA